ncbi:MAG: rod shape-determining protein MreC [Holosporaceae bacterium]|jgi:rod shape-determining protein MreC|nr:rod shape-determining protein MreC [Holosporaceae bacterium]
MHKTGKKSFTLFRRFKKRRVFLKIFFFLLIIVLLHTKSFVPLTEKCKILVSSARVALHEWYNACGNYLSDLSYCLTNDVEGVLIKLHDENIRLREEIESLKRADFENRELRKLLSLREQILSPIVVAKVVNIFSGDFIESCILNVGRADGVSVGDAVRNSDGLVGRVTEAHDAWSHVLLISDMNSGIPVKIGERQINAIMTGCNCCRLRISVIHDDILPEDGETVSTSGYGICEGIPVGKIEKDGKKISVKPFVNFNSLKFVVVLKK